MARAAQANGWNLVPLNDLDKVHAPQWLKAGLKPTNSHVRACPASFSGGQVPIASCVHPQCSRGGDLIHQGRLNWAAWFFKGWPVSSALAQPLPEKYTQFLEKQTLPPPCRVEALLPRCRTN